MFALINGWEVGVVVLVLIFIALNVKDSKTPPVSHKPLPEDWKEEFDNLLELEMEGGGDWDDCARMDDDIWPGEVPDGTIVISDRLIGQLEAGYVMYDPAKTSKYAGTVTGLYRQPNAYLPDSIGPVCNQVFFEIEDGGLE